MPLLKRRILLIEDDEGIARLLRLQLEPLGFNIHAESTGTSGISYAADHHPDLVMLDVRLPDISGYEVCRQLKRLHQFSMVPILMETGMSDPEDEQRGRAAGADAYITKPFDLPKLSETLSSLLREAS